MGKNETYEAKVKIDAYGRIVSMCFLTRTEEETETLLRLIQNRIKHGKGTIHLKIDW